MFVVPTGFHDAYVAAPSRKAALAAWGSEHDLFARGVAQEVTDEALMAEPLARPGEVVKRSRGTTAEQIAALPDPVPKPAPRKASKTTTKPRPSPEPSPEPSPKPRPPKPSRDALDMAERALREGEERHRAEDAAFAERQAALDRDRRAAGQTWTRARAALTEAAETERARYDEAVERWRG